MEELPKIPLEVQRRIDRRWAARFKGPNQQLKDRRLEMAGRKRSRRRPSKSVGVKI